MNPKAEVSMKKNEIIPAGSEGAADCVSRGEVGGNGPA